MPSLALRPETRPRYQPISLPRAPLLAIGRLLRQNHLLSALPDEVWNRIFLICNWANSNSAAG